MNKDIIKYFRTPEQIEQWNAVNKRLDSVKKERESFIYGLKEYNTDAMKAWRGSCFRKKDGREMIMILYPAFSEINEDGSVSVNSYRYYTIHMYYEWVLRVPTIKGDFMDMSDILPNFEAEEECDWEQISLNMFNNYIQQELMNAWKSFENQK